MTTAIPQEVQANRFPLEDYGSIEEPNTTPQENINEATYLFIIAGTGVFLNLAVVACIVTCKHLRKMTSAFIVHGCILDIIKCGYCIPFAQSILGDEPPSFCTVLGGSYVVVITASGFNIVAMICCEAYTFSEYNVGATEPHGTICCVVFGIVMVYIGSVIIHLGPTIIGESIKRHSNRNSKLKKFDKVANRITNQG